MAEDTGLISVVQEGQDISPLDPRCSCVSHCLSHHHLLASESSWEGLRVSDGRLPGFESNRDVTLGNFLNLAKPPLAHL